MPASPWKSFTTPQSDREYHATLSYLLLNSFIALPKFMRYTLQIRRQLTDSEGLIGYSMAQNIPSRKFWSLSVWEDGESLMRFVGKNPHGRVMTDLVPHMGQTKFIHWKARGWEIPPDWEEAKGRMPER